MKNIDGFGTIKLFSYSKRHYHQKKLIADKETRVCIYFNKQSANIRLSFPGNELQSLNDIGSERSIFKNPRLKRINNNEFVLSGLWFEGEKMFLALAKFNGKIPDAFAVFEDDLAYPEDYWT